MKTKILFADLFEADEEETDEEVIDLGRFVRAIIKAGGKPSYNVFRAALNYVKEHPELDDDTVALAFEHLAGGRIERYYDGLKSQNKSVANYF